MFYFKIIIGMDSYTLIIQKLLQLVSIIVEDIDIFFFNLVFFYYFDGQKVWQTIGGMQTKSIGNCFVFMLFKSFLIISNRCSETF